MSRRLNSQSSATKCERLNTRLNAEQQAQTNLKVQFKGTQQQQRRPWRRQGGRFRSTLRISPAMQRANDRHTKVFMVNSVTSVSRLLTADAGNKLEKPVKNCPVINFASNSSAAAAVLPTIIN
jgi:fructosamine-3-kinase